MLKQRLQCGLPLLITAIAAFCWPGKVGAGLFLILCFFFMYVGIKEFHAMSAAIGVKGNSKLVEAAGLLTIILTPFVFKPGAIPFTLLLIPLIVLIGCFIDICRKGPGRDTILGACVTMAGYFYVCYCLQFLVGIYFSSGTDTSGRLLVLFVVFSAKFADIGAFIVGSLTAKRKQGNHKIAPKLSPKKSWEGLFGGILFSTLTACICVSCFSSSVNASLNANLLTYPVAVAFGIMLPIVGLLGDVAESAMKRSANFKDSGNIPGLGGALDILDSLIPAAPLFYLWMLLA